MEILKVLLAVSLFIASSQGQTTDGNIDCPLCANSSHQVFGYGTFVTDNGVITCDDAFKLELSLPPENCTAWQSRGENICECAAERPETNDCRLCDDGDALPQASLAGLPGVTCSQLQVDAQRDLADRCPIWQQTIGNYCGCNNTANDSMCRLCGANYTFDSYKTVPGFEENTTISCGELEFSANLDGSDSTCQQYQFLFEGQCCEPAEGPNGDIDGSSSLLSIGFSLLFAATAFLLHNFERINKTAAGSCRYKLRYTV
eukprot:scaffold16396_cov140-Cylindrotheca_fusiformis.AAC.8